MVNAVQIVEILIAIHTTLRVIGVRIGRSKAQVQIWEIIASTLFATPTIPKIKRSRAMHEH